MENLDTLMGKYGDEGDKLIFKILNNGLDNPAKQDQARKDFETILSGKNNKGITQFKKVRRNRQYVPKSRNPTIPTSYAATET